MYAIYHPLTNTREAGFPAVIIGYTGDWGGTGHRRDGAAPTLRQSSRFVNRSPTPTPAMEQQQLHIVDAQPTPQTDDGDETTIDTEAPRQSQFDQATEIALASDYQFETRRFLRSLLDEFDREGELRGVRRIDRLDVATTDDVDLADLLVLPDETIVFVGRDPTTRDAETSPLFGFVIEPWDSMPAPQSARGALDLLRPIDVQRAFETSDDEDPDRQGEWWLLPSEKVPVGSTFRPGLDSKPYGASPLGNHVPREYGFAVRDETLLDRVSERWGDRLPSSVATVPEVIEWIHANRFYQGQNGVPTWDEFRDAADEIFVRGTLRHRENEHYMEDVGDQWHRAITHGVDVWTGDDVMEEVRLD